MIRVYAQVILNYPPFRIRSTNCCIHMVVPPDEGPRYARNMYGLMKYTKNKLCIKLVFLYMMTPCNLAGQFQLKGKVKFTHKQAM